MHLESLLSGPRGSGMFQMPLELKMVQGCLSHAGEGIEVVRSGSGRLSSFGFSGTIAHGAFGTHAPSLHELWKQHGHALSLIRKSSAGFLRRGLDSRFGTTPGTVKPSSRKLDRLVFGFEGYLF